YDGQELGYHTIDPADGCHRLAYGYTGNDKKGYDFAKNGFSELLDVDVDFYAEFSFKHYVVFEYSKSTNLTASIDRVDLSAADKAKLAAADEIAGGQVDAGKAKDSTFANSNAAVAAKDDGTDEASNADSLHVREKLKLVSKRYDEFTFKLKSKVEIDQIAADKRKLGQKVRYFGYANGETV
ncbi:hypothetical protein JCM10212_004251, partial [Sporobolomyces blumeae]